jgi:ubiquinone/menaquinone biosynthesis C-methylase UbiE
MLTPARIYEEELLDAGEGTDEDVRKNLLDLRRINRLLGGTRVVLDALSAIVDGSRVERLSLLDVGTGSADIPADVHRWCKAHRIEPFVAALDLSERNLRITRSYLSSDAELSFVRADALNLPFAARSFDYVTASLFLHHFCDEDVVRLIADFARVARRAVIVNDLVRNLVPYYFSRVTGPFLATSFLTRNDGPVSVLRGFTANELAGLARRAGVTRFRVKRMFPYRLSLVADVNE